MVSFEEQPHEHWPNLFKCPLSHILKYSTKATRPTVKRKIPSLSSTTSPKSSVSKYGEPPYNASALSKISIASPPAAAAAFKDRLVAFYSTGGEGSVRPFSDRPSRPA